jgi:hypothetical protein
MAADEAREARRLRRRRKKNTRPMIRAIATVPPAAMPAMEVVLRVGSVAWVFVGAGSSELEVVM